MEQKRKVILLAGPTGSGKSKLALHLAAKFNGEIINAEIKTINMYRFNFIFQKLF